MSGAHNRCRPASNDVRPHKDAHRPTRPRQALCLPRAPRHKPQDKPHARRAPSASRARCVCAARTRGKILWCVVRQDLFAPALAQAGLPPDRVIYVEAGDEKFQRLAPLAIGSGVLPVDFEATVRDHVNSVLSDLITKANEIYPQAYLAQLFKNQKKLVEITSAIQTADPTLFSSRSDA